MGKPLIVKIENVHECFCDDVTELVDGSIKTTTANFLGGGDISTINEIDSPDLDRFMKSLSQHPLVSEISELSRTQNKAHVYIRFAPYPTLLEILQANKCVPMAPIITENGVESAVLLVPSSKRLGDFMKDCEIMQFHTKIIRKKYLTEEDMLSQNNIQYNIFKAVQGILSPRQVEIFQRACKMGYYAFPRKLTLLELATAVGLGESTVRHHLRLAEQKLLPAVNGIMKAL